MKNLSYFLQLTLHYLVQVTTLLLPELIQKRSQSLILNYHTVYLLLHNMRVLEMIFKSPCPLNSSVSQGADLLTVKTIPLFAIELIIESRNELCMDEVDERIAHITSIVVVDGQVEEIKLNFEWSVELFKKQILCVLVWDISDH